MSEKCRYGRDSEVFYVDSEVKRQQYMCPRGAEVEGFCIFHKEGYWEQNKENEERVRKLFMEEIEQAKNGQKLFFIGYHLPDVKLSGEIKGEIYFNQTTFQSVDFKDATFQERAEFRRAIFLKEAESSYATFQQPARFDSSTFMEAAKFDYTRFLNWSNFEGVRFSHWAYFDTAEFEEYADFSDTEFHDDTDFMEVIFLQEANFRGATFKDRAYFCDSIFFQRADFSRVRFEKRTNFNNTEFRGSTLFKDVTFITEDEISNDKKADLILFRRVEFVSPEKIIFENCNLSCVSFIYTDITRVKFRNIKWPNQTGWKSNGMLNKLSSRFGKIDVYMLLDDNLFERKKKDIEPNEEDEDDVVHSLDIFDLTIENVLTLYRMLRENYEYNVDYETAGKFFVGEMEARRRNFNSISEKTILELYKILALYGQSYTRPLAFLLILIISFAFWRGLLGGMILFFQGMVSIDIVVNIILESFAVSLQLKGTKGIDIIQRILSIPLLVLFGLALRRRFERRFRH